MIVKLLMFYTSEWWYRTARKSLEEMPDVEKEESLAPAAVIFCHSEEADEQDFEGVLKKCVKNIKWLAGKFETKNIVLHSFNHLSSSKSSPAFALRMLDECEARLANAGYAVMRTPFGYFNEFRMHVAGDSLAKVFKEF